MDSFDLVDENGRLTQRGIETIRLAMRDEAMAAQILAGLRTGLIYKLTNAQAILNKMSSLPSLSKQEDIDEVVRKHLEFTAKLTIGVYSDILAIFDLIDAIGKNSIQSNFDNNKIQEAVNASQRDSRVIEWVERRLDERVRIL
ncbi:MAG: hypothetical protein WBZ36_30535 [Candidatus Nitrosopolaris sp.]